MKFLTILYYIVIFLVIPVLSNAQVKTQSPVKTNAAIKRTIPIKTNTPVKTVIQVKKDTIPKPVPQKFGVAIDTKTLNPFKYPPPTPGYLDTFNTILKHQQDVFGSNFYHDNEITLASAIRGLRISTWFPETRVNGKAYKECNCGVLIDFHQFIFDPPPPINGWRDFDLNFHVKRYDSSFNHFFDIGAPGTRIKSQIDLAVKAIAEISVPTSDGWEEIDEITGDPKETQSMEFEVQPAFPTMKQLKPDSGMNMFGDYKFEPGVHYNPVILCGYGPWVRDILHPLGYGRPEIHPLEQFWWKSNTSGANREFGYYNLNLVNDASGRFMYGGDKALNQLPLPGVFAIGFEVKKGFPIEFGITNDLASHAKSNYTDRKEHFLIIDDIDTIVRATELNAGPEDYYNIGFERVTQDANNVTRGYLVIKSVIGLPMKTSEFISTYHLQDKINFLQDPDSAIEATRFINNVLYVAGCHDNLSDLLSRDSLRFFGGISTTVRKYSLQKVTVEVTLQKIKRLNVNSYREKKELNGHNVEIHVPTLTVPPQYNEKCVTVQLRGDFQSAPPFYIPQLNVGDSIAIPPSMKVSWTGLISENPKYYINCYQPNSNQYSDLGSFVLTGDPLQNRTNTILTQLEYEDYPEPVRHLISGHEGDPPPPETSIPVTVNLFEITYSYKVVPQAVEKQDKGR